MKTALLFALKFVAITVPLVWLWVEWGRMAYGDLLHAVSGFLYELFGWGRPPSGSRERFVNIVPFLVLVLLTPRLSPVRRWGGLAAGLGVLFVFHMIFHAIGQAYRGRIPLPVTQLSDALPFVLWLVIAHEFVRDSIRAFSSRAG